MWPLHYIHINTTCSHLGNRSSNLDGYVVTFKNAPHTQTFLLLWMHRNMKFFMIKLEIESIWGSLIFHYRTLNDYYLPYSKLFFFFLVKNLFVLFKQHLFYQNVLTDFFLIFFFFLKHEHDLWIFSCFKVLASWSSPFFIQGLNHTKGSIIILSMTSMSLEAVTRFRISAGKAEAETHHEPFITTQLASLHWKKQYSIF